MSVQGPDIAAWPAAVMLMAIAENGIKEGTGIPISPNHSQRYQHEPSIFWEGRWLTVQDIVEGGALMIRWLIEGLANETQTMPGDLVESIKLQTQLADTVEG